MAERMTRYQLAFAPFLNKYINDELSKHYGGRRVTGVLPGLQNQCGAWYVPGGFDSHMSPPKERKKNMGMNQTPVSERVHIGFFGKRNAGKSSVMNAVTGQDLAVVSDVKGTTTDPVYKTMELLPLGPVVMMDTPGIDDEGELGELRVKKSYQVLNKTDIAVVVIDGTCGVSEEDLKITERIQKKNIPYIIVLNKCERFTQEDERLRVQENAASYLKTEKEKILLVSAADKSGIYELKEELGALKGKEEEERKIVGDLLEPSDFVVLVVPIDSAAPKGRLILPQQQTIRDILDADASAIVVKETELTKTLASLGKKPKMVITDSQVFGKVAKDTPKDILLKRDIDFINKIKLDKEYQARTRTWKDYTREEQADLIMRYVEDIELDIIGTVIAVKQINFRESICKPCQELFDKGYIDTNKPAIFGNVLGNVRFSNYLS